jgi:hypothetical protein
MVINRPMLITAPSGLGKTNFITNYIISQNNTFGHIYIYAGDPNEDIYEMLKHTIPKDQITVDSIDHMPALSEFKTTEIQKLIIVDDWINSGKKILEQVTEFAIRCRKKNFTLCMLSQSYFAVPKKIREQIRYLVLLKSTDTRNLNLILSTIDTDIDKETIKKIIKNATRETLNSCIIDLQNREINKTFRKNINNPNGKIDYYILEDENNNEIKNVELFSGSGIIN